MAPIRVALIGLSASSKTNWANEGHLPYLLSPRGESHYEVVALLNSSVKAAEAAREYYKLSPSVKAYGSPEDLAADQDVDLVVCNTRADTHLSTTAPSLRAGKSVYIEWPLAESYEAAVAVTGQERIDNSILGVQGRVAPVVLKLKEVLKSGRIGRVLSSDVKIFGNLARRDGHQESLAYFADRKVGGNPITIAFSHHIDFVHEVLGEFDGFQSRMQLQRPVVQIRDDNDVAPAREIVSDVPDLVVVHGKLAKGKADIADDATLSVTFRTGPQFKGTPGSVWTINGEKGEIMVTSAGAYLHVEKYNEPIEIKLHDYATDEVVPIEWDWKEWQKELPVRARIVAELYERFAHWWENGKPAGELPEEWEWPRVHDGVPRLRELAELFREYDAREK
ncbi:NAD(P)-binding protein [Xylaria intraflava]|nr:NAD(P)-binding protein [Xylaria intraflava]